ncbi:hypothetical protein MIMGU_mgv1a026179mg, partial [Erythranthe guttata]
QFSLFVLKPHVNLDPYGIITSNWTNSSSVCSWIGVTCDLRNHRVTALNISHMSLSGTIPPQIENLSFLVSLDLSFNLFSGVIHQQLSLLHRLKFISLQNNSFTGFIPSSLSNLTNLRVVDFSSNYLQGNIPHVLGRLHNLHTLNMDYNHLSGHIPSSVFNLSALKVISFRENELSGSIPSGLPREIGKIYQLEVLQLYSNSFTGFIPLELFNMSNLIDVDLSENSLSGSLPTNLASIGNFSTSLQYLYVYNCNINGVIPAEIANLSNLVKLSLYMNGLSGNIPLTINYLQKLQGLYLYNNDMRGSIPEGLCDLHNLGGQNNFFGPIPECLGNITSLRDLSLESNMLTSSIPSSIWRLRDLMYLDFSSNSLIGFLPPEIGNLLKTILINLSMNQFSESIPSTIENLISLNALSLAHNLLEGFIPDSVGRMISLISIDLSYNSLSGSIPKSFEKLQYLDYLNVSFNALRGEIPTGGLMYHFATIIGIVALILLLSLAFISVRYKRKHKAINGIDGLVPALPERISYYELLQATEHFSETNLIGMGGFGSVYKAVRRDGRISAVKVFNSLSEAACISFVVECEVLRNIRHRNLTKVISSCSNEDFKALVLEYMPNGNLKKWVYSHNYCLDLMQRLNIMIDVACALEYLHHGYSILIVHCDLKPSNVLLDEEMVAHVSDFGIAKLLGEGESTMHTNTLATMGYIAPG